MNRATRSQNNGIFNLKVIVSIWKIGRSYDTEVGGHWLPVSYKGVKVLIYYKNIGRPLKGQGDRRGKSYWDES